MPARPASYATICARMNHHSRELAALAAQANPPKTPAQPRHLAMTDAEIDREYFSQGKRFRNVLKSEAAQWRAQQAVAAILAKEKAAQ